MTQKEKAQEVLDRLFLQPHYARVGVSDQFLREYAAKNRDRASARVLTRGREYWGMLEPMGDGDFSDVARHLTSFFPKTEMGDKSVNLKLVLHIRKLYKHIFDRLI